MNRLPLRIVDVFTAEPLLGDPVAKMKLSISADAIEVGGQCVTDVRGTLEAGGLPYTSPYDPLGAP